MKEHEGRPMDAEAVPNLLGDVKKWIKTIKGRHGKYREGLYGLLNSTYVNGSDITGSYVASNDPAHVEFSDKRLYEGNAGRVIGQKLMQLFTQSGAYYNENGMTVKNGKLQTRGIIIEVPHQS